MRWRSSCPFVPFNENHFKARKILMLHACFTNPFLVSPYFSSASSLYRVFHQLADLGWVDNDLGSSALCLILLRQMGFRNNRLCNQERLRNLTNLSQPNPGPQSDGTPCRPGRASCRPWTRRTRAPRSSASCSGSLSSRGWSIYPLSHKLEWRE